MMMNPYKALRAAAIHLFLTGCSAESRSVPNADTSSDSVSTPTATADSDSGVGSQVSQTYMFRAGGNEPGWMLSLSDSLLTLRWDYDEHHIEILSPQIEQTASGKRVTANGDAPQDTIRVVVDIRDTRCADDMSGQQFPAAVTVHINGRTLNGCGGNPVALLSGGTWDVISLNGKPVVDSSRITMDFSSEGKLTGTAGCNRYSTSFTLSPESMHVNAPAATRMACGGAIDRQEREFWPYSKIRNSSSSTNAARSR